MKKLTLTALLLLLAACSSPTPAPTATPPDPSPTSTPTTEPTATSTPTPTPQPTATPSPTPGPGLTDLLETPQAAYLEADVEAAEAAYRDLIDLYPAAPEPYLGLATIFQRAGDEDSALEVLEGAPATDPEVLRRLAAIYQKRAAYTDLLDIYAALTTLEPDNADLYIAAGVTHARLAQPEPAIEALQVAQTLDPFVSFAWVNAAAAASAEREYETAVTVATAGLEANPDSDDLHVQRGLAHLSLDDVPAATADFQTAADLNEFNIPAHLWLGRVLYEAGDYDAAFAASDRAGQIGVLSGITGAEQGYQAIADAAAAQAQTDREEAFNYMASRIFDYGSQNALLIGYARIDLIRDQPQLAVNRLSALVLRGYTPALYWRGIAHIAIGEDDLARDDFQAFIEVTSSGPLAEDARRRLAD